MKRRAWLPALALAVLLTACAGDVVPAGQGGTSEPGAAAENTVTPDSTPPDSGTVPKPSGETEPEAVPAQTPMTEAELKEAEAFLNQDDCYGFLLSDYASPLDADLSQVFYSGAGVAGTLTDEMTASWLKEMGYDELYTELTFVSAADVDAVLERRTGCTLAEFRDYGNTTLQGYMEKWDGYFHMAGDTNRIQVSCVSGVRYSDGSALVESVESSPWVEDAGTEPDESWSTFETALVPGGDGWQFGANLITGGWMRHYMDELAESMEPMTFTAEKPFFDQWYMTLEEQPEVLPVTLELLAETPSGGATVDEWTEAHWDTWMTDTTFFERCGGMEDFADRDEWYLYEPGVGENGAFLNVYDAWDGSLVFADCDFTAFLYPDALLNPDNTLPADLERSAQTAQSVRWARLVNGCFFVSTFHTGDAADSGGMNGYVTCLDYDGRIRWRSEPLVCSAENFEILGVDDGGFVSEGVILCGSGFSGDGGELVQLNMETGQVLARTPLDAEPEALVYANGVLYVHCAAVDYEFEVTYG